MSAEVCEAEREAALRLSMLQIHSARALRIPVFHWLTLHLLFRWQRRFVYTKPTKAYSDVRGPLLGAKW